MVPEQPQKVSRFASIRSEPNPTKADTTTAPTPSVVAFVDSERFEEFRTVLRRNPSKTPIKYGKHKTPLK
jgi:hypothetical protein